MPPKLSDDKRAAILADIKAGKKARNQIARDHEVSTYSVTKIASEAQIERPFSREQTKNAIEAKQMDNAASRAKLAERFLLEAHRALDDLHKPHTAFNFGGKDNTFNEQELPEPPTVDKRNLMIIAATATDKSIAIDRHDTKTGAEKVGSLLGSLLDDLVAKHGDTEAG